MSPQKTTKELINMDTHAFQDFISTLADISASPVYMNLMPVGKMGYAANCRVKRDDEEFTTQRMVDTNMKIKYVSSQER
jgi:hypothetical protein